MIQTAYAEQLGSLGLLERLDQRLRKQGTSNYQFLIERVRNKDYKGKPGIKRDDIIPDCDLYNAVGAIYPLLNRQQRDDAIRAHLSQLKFLNYVYVNLNHTPNIREPLLLADIISTERLFWPGLRDEEQIWDGKRSFEEIEKDVMTEYGLFDLTKVKSDFLVAYALMRKDLTSFGEEYVRAANPEFLNRVMKGIVTIGFANIEDNQKINKRKKKLKELLPESVHDRIDILIQESDWTNLRL